jgi:hypothetical protein
MGFVFLLCKDLNQQQPADRYYDARSSLDVIVTAFSTRLAQLRLPLSLLESSMEIRAEPNVDGD